MGTYCCHWPHLRPDLVSIEEKCKDYSTEPLCADEEIEKRKWGALQTNLEGEQLEKYLASNGKERGGGRTFIRLGIQQTQDKSSLPSSKHREENKKYIGNRMIRRGACKN